MHAAAPSLAEVGLVMRHFLRVGRGDVEGVGALVVVAVEDGADRVAGIRAPEGALVGVVTPSENLSTPQGLSVVASECSLGHMRRMRGMAVFAYRIARVQARQLHFRAPHAPTMVVSIVIEASVERCRGAGCRERQPSSTTPHLAQPTGQVVPLHPHPPTAMGWAWALFRSKRVPLAQQRGV